MDGPPLIWGGGGSNAPAEGDRTGPVGGGAARGPSCGMGPSNDEGGAVTGPTPGVGIGPNGLGGPIGGIVPGGRGSGDGTVPLA